MMDLTKKALPNTVLVGGRAFFINTDFRVWMKFENLIKNLKQDETIDAKFLFRDEFPKYCSIEELLAFSRPPHELPRPISKSNAIPLDYELDGDLIYAAFLQQYGIDLVDVKELHWHKFLALLAGIMDSTKLGEVISYRCYEKQKENEDIYEKCKYAWEIIPPMSDEEQAELEEFNRMFGG